MRNSVLIFLLCFVGSCTGKNDRPETILKPEKMQDVFWDYIRADVYASEFIRKDSTKNLDLENARLQDKIFKQHHITREDFDKSYTWYSNHKELMTKLMDSMIARKQREKTISKPIFKSL
jgi:hypothetical protein